jgi:hypothetical protein
MDLRLNYGHMEFVYNEVMLIEMAQTTWSSNVEYISYCKHDNYIKCVILEYTVTMMFQSHCFSQCVCIPRIFIMIDIRGKLDQGPIHNYDKIKYLNKICKDEFDKIIIVGLI